MMRVFKCVQRSDEWRKLRRGVPTASSFHQIVTPKQGKPSGSQSKYITRLIAEEIDQSYSSEPDDAYTSGDMDRGIAMEAEARNWYSAFIADEPVIEVGFCLSDCGRYGCSPDGLVGDDGVLEIKCPNLETHIGYLRHKTLPTRYRVQCHGELLVTGRKWLDFVSYSPDPEVESMVVRVYPDDFTRLLKAELESFLAKYLEARIKTGRTVEKFVPESLV